MKGHTRFQWWSSEEFTYEREARIEESANGKWYWIELLHNATASK
jgi:hypothetical protein